MNVNDIFPSKYLKAAELSGREVPVKIEAATIEKLGDESKLLLTFVGKKKGMICNRTNADRIAHLYGPSTEAWIGQEIVLYAEMVKFGSSMIEGLRVKAPVKSNGKSIEDTF